MDDLKENIWDEKEWRQLELTSIKNISCNEKFFKDEDFKILYKYYIPTIYSLWEGFLKDSLNHYSSYLNRNKLNNSINVIANIVEEKNIFNKNSNNFHDIKNLIKEIQEILEKPKIKEDRPKSHILDYKNSNLLLEKFDLPHLKIEYQTKMNNLKIERNMIAHGQKFPKDYFKESQNKHSNEKESVNFKDLREKNIEYVDLVYELLNDVMK